MKTITWDDSVNIIDMVKREIAKLHDAQKTDEQQLKLVSLRRLSTELHYRRIELCIQMQKSLKKN